jgi:hypothetical protein
MTSPEMYREISCYQDGTYTMPWVEGFIPYGKCSGTVIWPCSGCAKEKELIWWITHNVNRKDNNNNDGDYTQVSRYCENCQAIFDQLARKIHKRQNKRCVIL